MFYRECNWISALSVETWRIFRWASSIVWLYQEKVTWRQAHRLGTVGNTAQSSKINGTVWSIMCQMLLVRVESTVFLCIVIIFLKLCKDLKFKTFYKSRTLTRIEFLILHCRAVWTRLDLCNSTIKIAVQEQIGLNLLINSVCILTRED